MNTKLKRISWALDSAGLSWKEAHSLSGRDMFLYQDREIWSDEELLYLSDMLNVSFRWLKDGVEKEPSAYALKQIESFPTSDHNNVLNILKRLL